MLWMSPEIKKMVFENQISIGVMSSMAELLPSIKLFMALPQGVKVPLKRPNLIACHI